MPRTETCGVCRYYVQLEQPGHGRCYRYPPGVRYGNYREEGTCSSPCGVDHVVKACSHIPCVRDVHWCGEYARRPA